MSSPRPTRQAGQAALESVALAALVALLLAVTGAWAVRALSERVSPPPLIARAAAPLAPLAPAPVAPRVAAPPAASARGGRAPAWRRVLRGGISLVLLRREAERSFGRALVGRLRERAIAAVRDPRVLLPGGAPPRAGPAGRDGAGARLQRARAYLARLRRMPLRQAVLRVSQDLGAETADRGLDLLTRRALRRVLGRALGGLRPSGGGRPAMGAAAAP